MLQHCGYARLANEAFLLDLIIREFRFECFVANKSREVQVFARFDEGLAARRNRAKEGVTGARINFYRQRLVGFFEEHRTVTFGRFWKIKH